MIDFHAHILPNIDDGARTLEDTFKIIKEAEDIGFKKIISTSHYIEDYFYKDEEERKKIIDEINKNTGNIEIIIGSEIYSNPDIVTLIKEKKASTINNTRYVLFEIPFSNNISYFNIMIDDLKRNRYIPIIAHPERYEIVKDNPKIVEEWKKRGILIQSNYESILGKYGKKSEEIVKLLLNHDLVDFLGSDVHTIGTYLNVKNAIDKIENIIGKEKFLLLSEKNAEKVLNNQNIEVEEKIEITKTFFGKYK